MSVGTPNLGAAAPLTKSRLSPPLTEDVMLLPGTLGST